MTEAKNILYLNPVKKALCLGLALGIASGPTEVHADTETGALTLPQLREKCMNLYENENTAGAGATCLSTAAEAQRLIETYRQEAFSYIATLIYTIDLLRKAATDAAGSASGQICGYVRQKLLDEIDRTEADLSAAEPEIEHIAPVLKDIAEWQDVKDEFHIQIGIQKSILKLFSCQATP